MTEPSLHFKLKGFGWAELEIASEDGTLVVPSISYCTNALDDLVRIGIDIATDKWFGIALFDHEPTLTAVAAQTSWIESNTWSPGARLSVIREIAHPFEPTGSWLNSQTPDFELDFDSRDALARLFLDCALKVREEHGEEGYRKLWGGQFGYPTRAVAALQAALSTAPQEVRPYST